MEWYTLDDQLRKAQVIEGFESFIWTERYSGWGDFQIDIPSSFSAKKLLTPGTNITKDDSYRVMTIETVLDTRDENNAKKLTVTGRSIERLLDDRIAMPALASLTTTPQWVITGTPGNIARSIFSTICVSHAINAGDSIPFYTSGTLLPAGSIAEPSTSVTIALDPDSVYNSIKSVCDYYNLGFRIVRNGDLSQLYFEVYTGTDRTSTQTANPAVIFSEDLDNLTNKSSLKSIATIKNVAYVFTPNGVGTVYPVGVDPTVSGFNRRALIVKADDITLPAGSALNTAIQQRGLQELTKYQNVYQFDGQIPQIGSYKYGVDYNLGDLVEERDENGFGSFLLVTENISVSDAQGKRSYPTLSVFNQVVPGTWDAWPASSGVHWADVALTVHWADV